MAASNLAVRDVVAVVSGELRVLGVIVDVEDDSIGIGAADIDADAKIN